MNITLTRPLGTSRLEHAAEMKPLVSLALEEAQDHCNFVVFAPEWLPADCRMEATTLRPEQPPGRPPGSEAAAVGQTPYSQANPSSLRTVIRGPSRALRIKQFLYDWAPCAAGIASLWESRSVSPFHCQDTLGWIGVDYHNTLGGCVSLSRTNIEVCVLEGVFEEEELRKLMRGLRVADPSGAEVVERMPFHALNYWTHYRVPPYRVPHGLWKCPYKRLYDRSERITLGDLSAHPRARALLPNTAGVTLDSLLYMEDAEAGHYEVEVIARRPANRHDMIWMTGMSSGSARVIPIPPTPEEDRPAEVFKRVTVRGTEVWLAALTAQYGAWEALFEEQGFVYAVWFGASEYWNEERVVGFVEELSPVIRGVPGLDLR